MRRMLLTLSTVFALVALAAPVDAQFNFGAQGAVITGVDSLSNLSNTYGLGARVGFQAPLLPIGVLGQGVYYFPDAADFSYSTYSLAASFRISTPIISPYALGGWQWRRTTSGGTTSRKNGAMFGVGVELNFGVSLFLEANFEFHEEVPGMPDLDNNPIVIKGGITFG